MKLILSVAILLAFTAPAMASKKRVEAPCIIMIDGKVTSENPLQDSLDIIDQLRDAEPSQTAAADRWLSTQTEINNTHKFYSFYSHQGNLTDESGNIIGFQSAGEFTHKITYTDKNGEGIWILLHEQYHVKVYNAVDLTSEKKIECKARYHIYGTYKVFKEAPPKLN